MFTYIHKSNTQRAQKAQPRTVHPMSDMFFVQPLPPSHLLNNTIAQSTVSPTTTINPDILQKIVITKNKCKIINNTLNKNHLLN